ncbi:MAG: hypothetical protein EOP06_11195 [Proteobacteria bacterium]|nr:MAG: hypothetical protein EOP06_11195 [Pseudomonadota bacterium]
MTFDSINKTYLRKYDLTTEFSKIAVPILNILGDQDVRFPVRVTKSFRNLNPQVEAFEILGSGHFPFLIKANQDLIIERVVSKFDLLG